MSKILKNNTQSIVALADVGQSIPASGQLTISPSDYDKYAQSSDVIVKISDNTLTVSDGSVDLTISDGVDLIKGLFPSSISLKPNAFGNIGHIDLAHNIKDSFGRLRTSHPHTIFDCMFIEDELGHLVDKSVTLSSTVAWNQTISSTELNTPATLNATAILQTRYYIPYHPGKSQLIKISGNMKGKVTGVKKYLGQYDINNGFFYLLDGQTAKVGIRSKTTGSVVDTAISQSNWNIDKMDGTGPSGVTLDFSKQQIFLIDYQWQGSGQVRFGVSLNDHVFYLHRIEHANILTTPYSQRATLPLRAEIINSGEATASSMHITCLVAESEGGWGPEGEAHTVNTGTTIRNLSNANTTLPVLCIRKNNTDGAQLLVMIQDFHVFCNSADDFLIQIIFNGTISGGSWVSAPGDCEVNSSATSISGGRSIYSYYLRGSATSDSSGLVDLFANTTISWLGSNIDGTSDICSIVATNLTATASIRASINYKAIE